VYFGGGYKASFYCILRDLCAKFEKPLRSLKTL